MKLYFELLSECWKSSFWGKLFIVAGGGWAILAILAVLMNVLSGMKH